MKPENKCLVVILLIGLLLFFIPFFWLKLGFVDLGGDAGRLYFIDPYAMMKYIYSQQNVFGSTIYAMLPYLLYLSIIHIVILSPTYMIAFDHGLQLSLAFISMYFVIRELMPQIKHDASVFSVALTCGIVYVGFITKTGWVTSLETQYQIFLNPLTFYFLLRYLKTSRFIYATLLFILSIVYSFNFGFSSTPQLMAFYPSIFLFLYIYFRVILRQSIPWKSFLLLCVSFLLLHAFHLLPALATVFSKDSQVHMNIFSRTSIENNGVTYFDANRQTLGKLSEELFGSPSSGGRTILTLIIPLITFSGFIKKKSKLLWLTGLFFAVTFFLVSANITNVGVRLYRKLFYIPGFTMFRSFNDKWYYTFIFFYALLFGLSFYALLNKKKHLVTAVASILVIISVIYRIAPFIQGKFYQTTLYQSRSVPVIFNIDPNLISALSYVKKLPDDGKALTLPLTLPYEQVIYGKSGGAYVGLSMVRFIGNKNDYPGFWMFGPHRDTLVGVLKDVNVHELVQLLSILNIRYIFRDTDPRIMNDFPHYPYLNYPFDSTVDLPVLKNQDGYDQLMKSLPLTTQYKKGFFEIMKLSDSVVRPQIYIPDIIYASQSDLLSGTSFRSAYVDDGMCGGTALCNVVDTSIPTLRFKKVSPQNYSFQLSVGTRHDPFVVVLSDDYQSSWTMAIDGTHDLQGVRHLEANGYANAWVIDPTQLNRSVTISGEIFLRFQKYFTFGWILSIGAVVVFVSTAIILVAKKYEKSK